MTTMPEDANTSRSLETVELGTPHLLGGLLSVVLLIFIFALIPSNIRPPAEPVPHAAAAAAPDHFADIAIAAKSAIVIDLSTGETLYAKNPDIQLPLASLAKVALALAVSEVLEADEMIAITNYAESATGPEHLSKGEVWRAGDVIDFTLVTSSNGGAEALAAVSGARLKERYPASEGAEAALWRMNDLARELSLEQTYFVNVSGLDMSETLSGAYGSSRDMAKLFGYASRVALPIFARTAGASVRLTSPRGEKRIVNNTNEALGSIPGIMMGKTGLTDLAGGNLAVVFDVSIGHPIVAIVLGSSRGGRFSDMEMLVERTRQSLRADTN